MPENEADNLTPAAKLPEKKREIAKMEKLIQEIKDVCQVYMSFSLTNTYTHTHTHACTKTHMLSNLRFPSQDLHVKMESLQQRREELKRKEQELNDLALGFDKFLKVYMCRHV